MQQHCLRAPPAFPATAAINPALAPARLSASLPATLATTCATAALAATLVAALTADDATRPARLLCATAHGAARHPASVCTAIPVR